MGLSAELAMHVLREAMEAHVRPELASGLIFEALGYYGDELPREGRDLEDFVEHHLFAVLAKNLDESRREAILEGLRPIIADIKASELPPPTHEAVRVEIPPAPQLPIDEEDEATNRQLGKAEPCVLVVASSDALERRLRMAVGTKLDVTTAHTLIDVKAAVFGLVPRVIIVDATDAPGVDPTELAHDVTFTSPEAVHVVWGTGGEWAQFLMLDITKGGHAHAMGLEEAEGVEPLIDVVRSYGMPPPSTPIGRIFNRPKG